MLFRSRRSGIVPALGMIMIAAYVAQWVYPHAGELGMPVLVYASVITAMAVIAMLCPRNHTWVAVGAVLFTLSDSLIAINQFVEPLPMADIWIMLSYYAAQYLLTYDARGGHSKAHRTPT